jgi:hypothetical protein
MNFSSVKNLALMALALLGLAALYWIFFSGQPTAPISASGPASPQETQFLSLSSELSPISFDTDIFNDPRFMGLVDLSTPVSDEAKGRVDPFAPLGK